MVKLFLATANVGSVCENVDVGLSTWINEVIATVQTHNPDFVALHFQETGGKYYTNGSPIIKTFFSVLVENFTVIGFHLVEGFIDSNSDLEQQWTALSNAYFVKANLSGVQIWDFKDRCFVPIPRNYTGRLCSGDELTSNGRLQKNKFPLHFFPNMKYSRKGILRTRWSIQGTVIDLVNIHLFHDLSNLVAASAYPSPFSQNRQRGLNHILENFRNDDLENHPIFIFGDFNFRVNSFDLFELLRREAATKELNCAADCATDPEDELIIDTKKFAVSRQEERFKHDWAWLKAYDYEASHFEDLAEFEVKFHPTYPFDEECPDKFMRTRPPAWCDRVLFTPSATDIISKESHSEYNLIGSEVCMGDHKPVYLTFDLKPSPNFKPTDDPTPLPTFSFDQPAPGNCGSKNHTPDILPTKPSRIVSFLRGNLSLTNGSQNPGPHPKSVTSSSISNYGSATGRKCCFLKLRSQAAGSETEVLTNGRMGKQNMLLSNDLGPRLTIQGDLEKAGQTNPADPVIGIKLEHSKISKEARIYAEAVQGGGSGSVRSSLCPGCSVM